MVTGSKKEFLLSDKNFTAELADYCHLSLLVDRDGLQWAVTTIDKGMVVEVGEIVSPSIEQLKTIRIFSYKYQSQALILRGSPATLIPSGLFQPSKANEILGLSFREWKGGVATADLPELNAKLMYADLGNADQMAEVVSFFRSKFPGIKCYSNTHLLVGAIMSRNKFERPYQAYIDISSSFFELYVAGKKNFQLYNLFEIETDEDVLYHVTNTTQQLGMNIEELTVYLSGDVELTGDRFKLFQSYFPKLSIHFGFDMPKVSLELGALRKQRFMSLLNSYACVS